MNRIAHLACILVAAGLCFAVENLEPRGNVRYDDPGSHLKSVANPLPVHNMPRGYMGGGEGSGSSYNGGSSSGGGGFLNGGKHRRGYPLESRGNVRYDDPGSHLKSVANPSPVHNMPRGYMGGGEGSGSSYNGGSSSGGGGFLNGGKHRRGYPLESRGNVRYDDPGSHLKSVANPSPVHNMPRGYMGGGEGSGSSYNGGSSGGSSFGHRRR